MLKLDKTKPIIFIGNGPSAYELQDRIQEFNDKSVYWGALGRFWLIEERILSQINKKLDIMYWSKDPRTPQDTNRILEFGMRGNNLYITNSKTWYEIRQKAQDWASSIFTTDSHFGPSSLYAALIAFARLGMQRVILIGFDGGPRGKVTYFEEPGNVQAVIRDTAFMNETFWRFWEYIGLHRGQMQIINLTGSAITCFPKRTMDEILYGIE